MGRIVAIDYGQKRVGFAASDELRICAHPLETVHVSQAFDYLKHYIETEKVDIIVIGEPKTLKNTPSDSTRYIEPFVKERQNKALVDTISATIILQTYMQQLEIENNRNNIQP